MPTRNEWLGLHGAAADLSDALAAVIDMTAALYAQLTDPVWLHRHMLPDSLDEALVGIRQAFWQASDLVVRQAMTGGRQMALVYLTGMVDEKVLASLLQAPVALPALAEQQALPVQTLTTMGDVVTHIAQGEAVVLLAQAGRALAIAAQGYPKRGIEQPTIERVIRGPKDSFTEDLQTNITLIRRRIKSPHLKLLSRTIGRQTRTEVRVAFLEGIARASLVREVMQRLSRIEIDAVLESSYLEELIEDDPWSIFPQVQLTERPDSAAAGLLEGRVAILTDNTPMVMLAPVSFWQSVQSAEDYYNRYPASSALRFLRFTFLLTALLLPSIYVAATTFHQEMIPTRLLLVLAASRENVPFPAVVEALLLEILFEIVREAGVRVPEMIGQAVSIVGALIIGSAAIQSGIASAPMVIVVSVTGIANFSLPRFNDALALRLLRFPMILLAGMLGFYGIILGLLTLLVHLMGLRSFGEPYLSPIAPLARRGLKDTVVRFPWWAQRFRPPGLAPANAVREQRDMRPHPPERP